MQWRCVMIVCLASLVKGRLIALPDSGEQIEILDEVHASRREVSNTCNNGYETVTNSTLCATDSPNYVPGSAGVSAADQQKIIDRHNHHRAAVSPTATNMMKVYWDDELAKGAEKWARQCFVGHDSALQMSRYIPSYGVGPGQNGAFGYSSWEEAVDGWHSEVQLYQYGKDPEIYIGKDGWKKVGHYTQVVTATVMLVGCGYAQCTNSYKKFYFCNYITGQSSISNPYKSGSSCVDCPNSCSNDLCDCGDKFCFNGGTIDIDACTCSCKFPFTGEKCLTNPCPGVQCSNGGTLNVGTCTCDCKYPFGGNTCDDKVCQPKLDPSHCGTQWPPSYCTIYINVPFDCPVMCGLCPAPCNGKTCQNGGTLDLSDCTCKCPSLWTGDTCETKDCPNQADPSHCVSQWPPEFCTTYPTYVPPRCPIMCGLCPPLCNGKICLNGGTLNVSECTCTCLELWTGKICKTKNCPNEPDPSHCVSQWPPEFCRTYPTYVPPRCPIMCGLCPAV